MSLSSELASQRQRDRAGVRQTRNDDARSRRAGDVLLIAGPALLAGFLCCYQLAGRSLGFDEAASVTIAAQHGAALRTAIAHDGGNMSGYYLLLHALSGLFGNSAFELRFPSAVANVVTVSLVGALAIRLFDRRVAAASGLLAAVSLPLVFWGQSARGYALMVAGVCASFLAFVVLVDHHAEAESIRVPWIAYVLFTALAMYASFVAVLVVPAQLLSLAVLRRALRPVATGLLACAACCVPLAVLAARRGSDQLFWVPRPSLTGALQVAESVTSSGLEPSFRRTSTSIMLLAVTLAALLAVLVVLARQAQGPADQRTAWSHALLACWLLVPLVLVVAESSVGQSIFLPRNLLLVLPAVALLLAVGLFDRRLPSLISWSALATLVALRALQLAPSYGVSPEDWRGATALVIARAQPGDCIAFYPSDGRMAFAYYLDAGPRAVTIAPRPVLPALPWDEDKPFVEDYAGLSSSQLVRLPSVCARLWVVSSHEGQRDGPPRSRANLASYLRLQAALARAYAGRVQRSFGYASPVRVELFAPWPTDAALFRRT